MKGSAVKILTAVAGVAGLAFVLCWGLGVFDEVPVLEEETLSSKDRTAQRRTTKLNGGRKQQVPTSVADGTDAPKADKKAARRNVRRPLAATVSENLYAHLKGEDRVLCEKVQEALDDDDFETTLVAAKKAFASKNPEVRKTAVEAMGWFGSKALSSLMPMMADSDEEVAQAAKDAWEMGLDDLDDAALKLAAAQAALQTLNDEDTLSMIGTEFASAAFDLIDGEDSEAVAQSRRIEIVRFLAEVIESPEVGVGAETRREASKEIFEQITSHEWVSVEEAELYLQDPENYESPEDRE